MGFRLNTDGTATITAPVERVTQDPEVQGGDLRLTLDVYETTTLINIVLDRALQDALAANADRGNTR